VLLKAFEEFRMGVCGLMESGVSSIPLAPLGASILVVDLSLTFPATRTRGFFQLVNPHYRTLLDDPAATDDDENNYPVHALASRASLPSIASMVAREDRWRPQQEGETVVGARSGVSGSRAGGMCRSRS
jgi:hypothetical protein